MSSSQNQPDQVRFGPFRFDVDHHDLYREEQLVSLAPQPLAMLAQLVRQAGKTVSRDELRREIWGEDQFVEFDQSLHSCVRRLRAALDDSSQEPRYIETVPRRGYRFVAPVETVEIAAGATAKEPEVPLASGRRRSPRRTMALLAIFGLALAALLLYLARDRPDAKPAGASSAVPEAQEAFLRGQFQETLGTAESLQAALEEYQTAGRLDPSFGPAAGREAYLLSSLGWNGGIPEEPSLMAAEAAARRALDLQPDNLEALLARGYVELFYRWDVPAATRSFARAVAAAPEDARVHSARAASFAAAGLRDEAVRSARRAEELDPVGTIVLGDLCWYLLYAEQWQNARTTCDRALSFSPGNLWLALGRNLALARIDPPAAVTSWSELLGEAGAPAEAWRSDSRPPAEVLAEIYSWLARRQEELLQDGKAQSLNVAGAHALAGASEPALGHLDDALRERQAFFVFLRADPRFTSLRQNEIFQALAAEIEAQRLPT